MDMINRLVSIPLAHSSCILCYVDIYMHRRYHIAFILNPVYL